MTEGLSGEIQKISRTLEQLRDEGVVRLAYLYGSFASGTQHARSDIDLAVFFSPESDNALVTAVDRIMMASDRDVEILYLNDEDESPFIVQQALKGTPLVEPDLETYYSLCRRVLHETESIRFRREHAYGA